MNLIRESQFVQLIAFMESNNLLQMSEVLIFKNGRLIDCYAYKCCYQVFTHVTDENLFLMGVVQLIGYLYNLHDLARLYHGDIKPDNVFIYKGGIGILRTDSDSLIALDPNKDSDALLYRIRTYTNGFASSELMLHRKNKVSYDFLMQEDFK